MELLHLRERGVLARGEMSAALGLQRGHLPLPADFPAALVFQMYLDPRSPSVLVDLLRPHPALSVEWVPTGRPLRLGMLTVVPLGQHVQVRPGDGVTLTSWALRRYTRPRCDDLQASVAASYGVRALGVVLTGCLDDGAHGAQVLHRHGGRVLVQDPATAEPSGMPTATLRMGCADVVMPLEAIPAVLTALVRSRGAAHRSAWR